MSVLKIPFLLSATLGIHITMTPPNPPPSQAEQLSPRGIERLAPLWVPLILKVGRLAHGLFQHAGFWGCGLAEIAVLLAASLSSPASTTVLKFLDRTGRTTHLKITPIFLLGWALNICGTCIRLYCYRRLRTLFTFQLSIRENHNLITTGLYSIIRHPSYTGGVLAGVGVTLCHLAPGSWLVECSGFVRPGESWVYKVVPIWVVGLSLAFLGLGTRIRKEDQMLRKRFGREWEVWAERVPYKVFPGLF
ncbi:hypothetical protein DFH07DRAFT_915952 [Mycena maculata]|uniref:Protein-S-isoprenylcysteine O-methyltransferase n=1 Tax=Mycena maculata TaxID=230809 RepID=A0AAD7JMS6_9AGAR|nr:hypothetical protein DFH07DRAFT_915952 [Mycena maculata]